MICHCTLYNKIEMQLLISANYGQKHKKKTLIQLTYTMSYSLLHSHQIIAQSDSLTVQ